MLNWELGPSRGFSLPCLPIAARLSARTADGVESKALACVFLCMALASSSLDSLGVLRFLTW